DAYPVELDVLPVGDVGAVAGEFPRDRRDGTQLPPVELATVDADPQHEELVLELLGLQRGGAATIDAGLALGVEPAPAEPAPQVLRVDAAEPTACVDIEDPLFHVERVVVLLGAFVGVERLPVADGPLAIALAPGRRPSAARTGAGPTAARGGRPGPGL